MWTDENRIRLQKLKDVIEPNHEFWTSSFFKILKELENYNSISIQHQLKPELLIEEFESLVYFAGRIYFVNEEDFTLFLLKYGENI